MSKYIFSEEEIKRVLLSSPMVLPESPVSSGIKGNNLKMFFYGFIRELMLLISEKLLIVEQDKDAYINEHNISNASHSDIRTVIAELIEKDKQLGSSILNTIVAHNINTKAHEDIREYIDKQDNAHINDEGSHPTIRSGLAVVTDIANAAYNLALGHSSVKNISSVSDIYSSLSSAQDKVVGDLFLVEDGTAPDFTYLGVPTSKDIAEAQEKGTYYTENDFANGNLVFENDMVYVLDIGKVKTSSRDIDTSILARKQEVTELKSEFSSFKVSTNSTLSNHNTRITSKENALTKVESTAETVLISSGSEYSLGQRTSLKLNLPSTIPKNYYAILSFHSPSVATAFDCPDSIVFTQDDCIDGKLYPVSNRLYEISIKNVNGVLVARVGGANYEVIAE